MVALLPQIFFTVQVSSGSLCSKQNLTSPNIPLFWILVYYVSATVHRVVYSGERTTAINGLTLITYKLPLVVRNASASGVGI